MKGHIFAAIITGLSLAVPTQAQDSGAGSEDLSSSEVFNIDEARAEGASRVLRECLWHEASRWLEVASPLSALEVAKEYCWVLRREYVEAMRPVAETVLRRQGIQSRITEQTLAMLSEDAVAMVMEDYEDDLLAELSRLQ